MGKEVWPTVNRAVLIIKMKRPFTEWLAEMDQMTKIEGLKKLEPEDIKVDGFDSKGLYLIPVFDFKEDYDRWLKNNFKKIFEYELNEWYCDSKLWPKDRSWKVFNEWLECEVQTQIFDMLGSKEPLGYYEEYDEEE